MPGVLRLRVPRFQRFALVLIIGDSRLDDTMEPAGSSRKRVGGTARERHRQMVAEITFVGVLWLPALSIETTAKYHVLEGRFWNV